MAAQVAATPARAAARLGRSGWNAYSFNVDYRTGAASPLPRSCVSACLVQPMQYELRGSTLLECT